MSLSAQATIGDPQPHPILTDFPVWVTAKAMCDHCYCASAWKKFHRQCCKCHDIRHKKFVSATGRALEAK